MSRFRPLTQENNSRPSMLTPIIITPLPATISAAFLARRLGRLLDSWPTSLMRQSEQSIAKKSHYPSSLCLPSNGDSVRYVGADGAPVATGR